MNAAAMWEKDYYAMKRRCERVEQQLADKEQQLAAATSAAQDWQTEHDMLKVEHDTEIGDFQQDVYELVCKLSGKEVDGAGSDAGWQEFTLAEIAEGLNHLKDQLADKEQQLEQAVRLAHAIEIGDYLQHIPCCDIHKHNGYCDCVLDEFQPEFAKWLSSPAIAPIRERVRQGGDKV